MLTKEFVKNMIMEVRQSDFAMSDSLLKMLDTVEGKIEVESMENLIITHAFIYISFWYATYVAKEYHVDIESVLLQCPGLAVSYCLYKNKRLESLESIVASDPYYYDFDLVFYAKDILKNRWPEIEYKILAYPYHCCIYAKEVIKGPWKEAEDAIKRSSKAAYLYGKEVLQIPEDELELRFYENYLWGSSDFFNVF